MGSSHSKSSSVVKPDDNNLIDTESKRGNLFEKKIMNLKNVVHDNHGSDLINFINETELASYIDLLNVSYCYAYDKINI